MTIFKTCAASHGTDVQLMMECISNWVESETGDLKASNVSGQVSSEELNNWLLILAGAMVFFMQVSAIWRSQIKLMPETFLQLVRSYI
jgi:hypothetical protein